jgi:hypothetical protein
MRMLTRADFKLAPLGDFADIYKPEWLANQPFGQMPFLIDEEEQYVIFESRAIIKCEWHRPQLDDSTRGAETT